MNLTNAINLFSEMLRVRRIEEAIAERYSDQEMRCPVHLSIGQEAIAVGICASLEKSDLIVSAHRSHAHYLAKGCSLVDMLCELYGKADGCAGGKGGSMHLIDLKHGQLAAVPIVGSAVPIAVGAGFGLKLKNSKAKVVVFLGDGATEEGSFAESLDFAALKELPVLFVVENNNYSVYAPIEERQHHNRSITKVAEAHCVKSFCGDGNDVLDVVQKFSEASVFMASTNAPALIELNTFRWLEHCGPNWDDDLGYRKVGELADWMQKCPIENFKNLLFRERLLCESKLAEIEQKIDAEITNAFAAAKSAGFPEESALFTNVYSSEV